MKKQQISIINILEYIGYDHDIIMMEYPLVNQQVAIEHGPCSLLIYPWKMLIFHSYVSLPEGI